MLEMLDKHLIHKRKIMTVGHKITPIFLVLCMLFMISGINGSSGCSEQWTELDMSKAEWSTVGDALIRKDKSFEIGSSTPKTGDLGGAVWSSYDFSQKRGLLISFQPTITMDTSFYGNQKFPQGFAVVLTASTTENLIGAKGSGIGYEGITNAIAFEFDFNKDTEKSDYKDPHFSVHYKVSGEVSASSQGCTTLCNIPLPNFYDNSVDGFISNIIFEIQMVGKKLTVKSNHGVLLDGVEFPAFMELLQQKGIFVGVTASMTQNKKVAISQFKVSEVYAREKGILDYRTSGQVSAGNSVSLYYSLLSTCGEPLKIYNEEFTGDKFQLIINGKEVKPETREFDDSKTELKLTISETKVQTYSALVKFKDHLSTATEFTIKAGTTQRFEICPPTALENFKITTKLEETKDYFLVPICSYDQYGNPKAFTSFNIKFKVQYPSNLVPNTDEEYIYSEDKLSVKLKVYISIFGKYVIFNVNFIEQRTRSYELMPNSISPEKSVVGVLYDLRNVQSDTTSVSLRVELKDSNGRLIPKYMFDSLKCSFDSSYVLAGTKKNTGLTVTNLNDDVFLLTTKSVSTNGKYTFVPIVQCTNIPSTELSCPLDEITKESQCEFYKEGNDVNKKSVLAYSDFLDKFIQFGETSSQPLLVSYDEYDNNKITELVLLDSNGAVKHTKSDLSITAKIDKLDLKVTQVGNRYSLLSATRKSFNPALNYTVTLGGDLSAIKIPVKFYSKNRYLSNVFLGDEGLTKEYVAFYKQNSLTLQASDNVLLFDLFEYVEGETLGDGSGLDVTNVKLAIGSDTFDSSSKNAKFVKSGAMISISSNALTKAGQYKVSVSYSAKAVATVNLVVEPQDNPYELGDEEGKKLTDLTLTMGIGDVLKFTLLDKYGNALKSNQLFPAYSKINVQATNTMKVMPNYDGKIYVFYNGRSKSDSVTFEFLSTKSFTITSSATDSASGLCFYTSYGMLKSNYNLTAEEPVSVSVFFLDKYKNILSTKVNLKNVNVYVQGKNKKEIVELTTSDTSSSVNGITYKGLVSTEGDYEVKIFNLNYPIECKGCNFRVSRLASTSASEAKLFTRLYILGNKRKIPVFTNEKRPQIVNKKNPLVIYIQTNDRYYNEINLVKSYSLYLQGSDKIGLCPYGSKNEEKGYFRVCSDQESKFNSAADGIYKLTVDTTVFQFYLTENSVDSSDSTAVAANSMIMQYEKTIYGKTNAPGFFVLDLRNKGYTRLASLDKSKVTVSNSDLTAKAFNGPEPGLLTVFLTAKKPGNYTFNVKYNTVALTDEYNYLCGCSVKKLSYKDTISYSPNGFYAFYDGLDNSGNVCQSKYNWNELVEDPYASLAITAYPTGEEKKIFQPKVLFNQVTGVVVLYFDKHVSGSLTLSSKAVGFVSKSNSLTIPSKYTNKDNFYVTLDKSSKTVKVNLLNDNFEKVPIPLLNAKNFDLVILRAVNDDFVTVKSGLSASSTDYTFTYDSSLLDAAGKYLFVVYYKGEELFCENCYLDVTADTVEMANTKVYHKEGNGIYYADSADSMSAMFQSNFPFFKVNLFSKNNNLVSLSSTTGLTVSLKSGSTAVATKVKASALGNVYVYVADEGRKAFLGLSPMNELTLTLTYSSKSYTVTYLLLNSYLEEPSSREKCYQGAGLSVINLQSSYVSRAGTDLELEVFLDGCKDEQLAVQDGKSFGFTVGNETGTVDAIPTDVYGGYMLFVKFTKATNEPKDAFVSFKKAKSPSFQLTVNPGYDISSISFPINSPLAAPNVDNQYAYILTEMTDAQKNSITNMGRNLFANDFFGLKVTDASGNTLPYKVSYNEGYKKLVTQIPISGTGSIKISAGSDKTITVEGGQYYTNALFEASSESNSYSFTLTARDSFYKSVSSPKGISKVTFTYFTINTLTEEVFSKELEAKLSSGKYTVSLPSNYPKYQVYGFVPKINSIPQVCSSCLFKNVLPNYIYTVDNKNYLPHDLSKKIYLIKDVDSPLFVYASENVVKATPTGLTDGDILSSDSANVLGLDYPGTETKLSAKLTSGTSSITLNAELLEYTSEALGKNDVPGITERYGLNAYVNNKADLETISFFMEARTDSGVLLKGTPSLMKSNEESAIESFTVISTTINGVYFVNVKFAKSGTVEYTLKYGSGTESENDKQYNTFQLNELPSFPVELVLHNKKVFSTNLIRYDVIATNQDSEEICDDRLNLYSSPTSRFTNRILYHDDESCKLLIQFPGDLAIESSIDDFYSDLTNDDDSLNVVNPHTSSLTVLPNVVKSGTAELVVLYNERSTLSTDFKNDEKTLSKQLNVYKYYTPTKFELVKKLDGLYSSSYSIAANLLNLKSGSVYAFVGSVGDSNIAPAMVHYANKINESPSTFSVEMLDNCGLSKPVNNLSAKRMSSGNSVEFKYPFTLRFKLLNSDKLPVSVSATDSSKVQVRVVVGGLTAATTEEFTVNLLVRQLNKDTFLGEVSTNDVSSIIHAPVVLAFNKYYFLEFIYSTVKFSSSLSYTKNPTQSPNVKADTRQYAYPKETDKFSAFVLFSEKKSTDVYFPSGSDTVQHACLFITIGTSTLILNENLDTDELSVEVSDADCSVAFVNSYLGCFAFTVSCKSKPENAPSLTATYKNVEGSKIYAKNFLTDSLKFSDAKSSAETFESSAPILVTFSMASGSTPITEINSNYFNVFINGEQLTKNQFTLNKDDKALKVSLDTSLTNTIPKKKQIVVVYTDCVNKKLLVNSSPLEVTVVQPEYKYSASSSKFSYSIQVPINLKVGDKFFVYLLIKDTDHACYFGDVKKLANVKAKITVGTNTYTSATITPTPLNGISSCEKVYLLDFKESSSTAGDFPVTVVDGTNTVNSDEYSIYVSPSELDAASCQLDGGNNFGAGDRFELFFKGSDSFGNELNYFDIADDLDIQFTDKAAKKAAIVEKTVTAAVDNSKVIFGCTIENNGNYEIKLFYKRQELKNFKGVKEITISFGECSLTGADPQVTDIDGRNTVFYPGEEVSINLQCKDELGNKISSQGSEIFVANIRLEGSDDSLRYDKQFIAGKYYFKFTPSENGKYLADITLNGKKYGKTLTFVVKSFNYNQYMCMDKRQYDKIEQCESKAYAQFVADTLGSDYVCTKITNGAVFKCPGKENCVANTIKCACQGTEYNGYCYPKDMDPIEQIKDDKVTCLSKMMTEGGFDGIVKCFDGTCRTSEEECNTKFECPVGYKSCANKCLLLNEECKITNECGKNEVLCWDLSCAEDYSSCPTRVTCPYGKVLCPDKTCKESGHCVQPNERYCASGEYQCPDFSCVKNKNDCSRNLVCEAGESLCADGECRISCQEVVVPEGKYRCKSGAYVDNSQLCPNEVFQPDDYVKCSSGGIATTKAGCAYVQGGNKITCPKTKPILCPDFECVEKSSECNPNVPQCPTHKPYQCWNNECRTSFAECPTPVTCPSITPVLCSSGICAKSKDDCQEVPETKCRPYYRCFDGTCVKSIELCPTHVSCGDAIKCWNGACVSKITECPSSPTSSCGSSLPFRCPDGSCRPEKKACSTLSVCPSTLPIKCFDNSCRANTDECPDYQSCGEHKVSCPDGTCAKTLELCNTPVTCQADEFLCFDGSCKKELSECKEPPFCQKNQVLCPNGACQSSRQVCKAFEVCSKETPIRCETNSCTNSLDQCSNKEKRCPTGYVVCPNGDCRVSEALCEKFECPKNKRHLCPEGVCVTDEKYCDDKVNSCPYNAPIRCQDGTCVDNKKKCSTLQCDSDKKQCPDGSCILEKEECPLENGCYKDRPFKCSDGSCINPQTTECTMALCPFKYPIQCANGNCVTRSSECPGEIRQDDKEDCGKQGLIMCVDGRCVPTVDLCRPFYECEKGYHRCQDGSCRVSEELCPKNVTCPEPRPFRCSSGMCVESEAECMSLICPPGYVRCKNDGYCARSDNDCSPEIKTKNGCPFTDQVKCSNGRCLSNEKCRQASNACPDDNAPFLCSNGECVEDKESCPSSSSSSSSSICGSGKDLCPSGRCVPDNNAAKRTQCTNSIGCPLHKPYRCSNGECVYRENDCPVNSISEYGQLISNMACDPSKPYLCADQTCVSDYTFCKTMLPCDGGRSKCANGFCVSDSKKCLELIDLCPLSNPIKCPSGTCAANIVDCAPSFNIRTCGDGEFYCTRLAKCVISKLDCLIYYDTSDIINNSVNRRLFENFVNPLDNEKLKSDSNNEFVSLVEEEGEGKEKQGVICYDGTIAGKGEKCPIVPGCKMGQYRCENGGCADKKEKCFPETDFTCSADKMKCPDGLCHKNCSEVAYHGCLVGQYQCTNGQCVKDEDDCIGYSMCKEPSTPFRCIDGSCKAEASDCPLIKRLGSVQNMTYTFNRVNPIHFTFALDNNKRTLATLDIPGNGLSINNSKSDAYARLFIEEVSSSILLDSSLYNHSTEFLFNLSNSVGGSEGNLNYENSIMSPVFKFYTKDKGVQFSLPGVINIIHNYYDYFDYDVPGINFRDYCLAKLGGYDLNKDKFTSDEHNWTCQDRKEYDDQTEFKINSFGVYAVILNPDREKINYFGTSVEKNFFLEYLKPILITFAIIVVALVLIFYIFFRVTRYRQKYHENRTKILLLQQQKQEYENMTTDIFGQTLGDNINGIVYKANPSYSITEDIKTRDTSLEEEIEKLQIQCKNVTDQNARLQSDIDELTDKYKILSNSIENMAK